MGDWNYKGLDIISDILNIPEENESFDAILCTEVFEHIINPLGAIKEFARLLKPNGKVILTVPFCSLTHFAPHFYYTGFSPYFFNRALAENGFEEIQVELNGNYFNWLAQELRRLEDVSKNHAHQCLPDFSKMALPMLLEDLEYLETFDQTSSQVLAFGLMITAKKI